MNNDFWKNKLIAFLHDPPDKALKIMDHEDRARNLLNSVGLNWVKVKADVISSSLQRLVFQAEGRESSIDFYGKSGGKYIHVGYPVFKHPVTACEKRYEYLSKFCDYIRRTYGYSKLDEYIKDVLDVEKNVSKNLWDKGDKRGYFRVWNYYAKNLKGEIAKMLKKKWLGIIKIVFNDNTNKVVDILAYEIINLPAETRCPDHIIWDHLDVTSAIYGATYNGRKPALLMFKISPVQDFIKNARKERDLWAGSHLLSFLTFQAVKVIVDEFGPDAIIFPHLRCQPFFDKEYEDLFKDVPDDVRIKDLNDKLKIANIPNRFLAIVGFKDQKEIENLKSKIKNTIKDRICNIFNYAWDKTITNDILEQVRNELTELKEKAEGKDKEKYEKALNELNEFVKSKAIYETHYRSLAEDYFRITLEVVGVPFDPNELGTDKKKSYEILENFVKGLKLPKEVERKYLDWLDMLKSFGTHPARIFDLYSLMFEVLEELVGIESRKFEKVEGWSAYKCSLCGELEAIGGRDYVLMRVLWSKIKKTDPILFKKNEHLCPICLVKRTYHEWLNEFEDDKKKRWDVEAGFESVSEVALKKRSGFIKEDGNKKIELTQLDILKECDILDLEGSKKNDEKLNVKKVHELRNKYKNLDNTFKNLLTVLITKVYKNKSLPKELAERPIIDDIEFFYEEKLTLDNLLEEYGFPRFDEIKKVVKDNNTLKEIEQKKARIESIISEIRTLLNGLKFEPEKYYSILIMDGDNMGKMLIGDEMKPVKEYLHPKAFNHLPEEAKEKVKEAKRLITPATHSAVSRALMHFSVNVVPKIVENHRGELIYAGGDDVLALLPIDSALHCAYEIRNTFGKDWDGWELLPSKTMSAGILIVHYKHPLYDALDKARSLEKKAKEFGRDAVAIGYLARSGSYDEVVFNWSLVEKLSESVADYSVLDLIIRSKQKEREPPYISERLSYDVVSVIENLPNDVGAIECFLKYELSRHYHDDKNRKKQVLEKLVSNIIKYAKRIRVTLSREELECVLGRELRKSDVRRVNDLIKSIIKECKDECPNVKDSLRFGVTSNGERVKGLEELFGISDENVYGELEGLILKKQVRDFFILLKILVNCDAELRCKL